MTNEAVKLPENSIITANAITIGRCVTIFADGRVEVRGDTCHAAEQFWEAVRAAAPGFFPVERNAAKYVIWSNEHSAWWAPNRNGYQWRLADAGLYTRREALEIVRGATWGQWRSHKPPHEVPICVDDLPAEARATLKGRI